METKPGYKTTEFWVSTLIAILGVLVATGVISVDQQTALADALQKIAGAVMSGAAAMGYAIGRGTAKTGIKPE